MRAGSTLYRMAGPIRQARTSSQITWLMASTLPPCTCAPLLTYACLNHLSRFLPCIARMSMQHFCHCINLCEQHDKSDKLKDLHLCRWPDNWTNTALQWVMDWIEAHAAHAVILGKPLILQEWGVHLGTLNSFFP